MRLIECCPFFDGNHPHDTHSSAKLFEDAIDVVSRRMLADIESSADLPVRQSFCQKFKRFALARSQVGSRQPFS